jgi:hypothetical protein
MSCSSSLDVYSVQKKPRTTLSSGTLIGIIAAAVVLLCILVFFFVYLRWSENSATLSDSGEGNWNEMMVLTESSPLTLAMTEGIFVYDQDMDEADPI